MLSAFSTALGEAGISPSDLLIAFLEQDGVPDPMALADARDGLAPAVLSQLEFVDQPGFRARMFTWAATGTTSLAPNEKIKVFALAYLPPLSMLMQGFSD